MAGRRTRTSTSGRRAGTIPDALGDEFAATLLWEDEIVVAVPLGHRLGARRQVTFEELAART